MLKRKSKKRATRVAASKKRRSNKAPSAKQLAARRKFVAMARARSRAAKAKKSVKRSGHAAHQHGDWAAYAGSMFVASGKTKADAIARAKKAVKPEFWHELTARKYKAPNPRRKNKTVIVKPKQVIVLDAGKATRRKYRNGYVDLVVYGQAQRSGSGWKVGGKVIPYGTGIVSTKPGFFLDKKTGFVFKRAERNPKKAAKTTPKIKAITESFSGRKVRAVSTLNVSNGTPANLAKLGKLVLIKAEKGTIKPAKPVWLCADSKGKLHLATTAERLIEGGAQNFGQVLQVEYETSKPHLGHKRPTIFFHKMGEEGGTRPELVADGNGGLKFRGGSYRITREGIVN